ncbi:MAG: FHA domain-containing protein [Acidobacteria bacterium]|nr:FHA domain-containing protein [Acidobacteriota bacterium]
MTEDRSQNPRPTSIDSLLRGVLGKLGDIFDGFTGRQWKPSSGLATSEIIERIKQILDSEAREVRGKGKVVPHSIVLKMQWDKFSTDDPTTIDALESELLVAAIDHINDRRYYTYAPMTIEVKPDYFTEGIRFIASFDPSSDSEEDEKEIHLSIPTFDAKAPSSESKSEVDSEPTASTLQPGVFLCTAAFEIGGFENEVQLRVPAPGRISVGRTAESMLTIDDTSVSKHHATLAISANGDMAVADTGSTNGTKVNNEKIAYGEVVTITGDDRVTFGTIDVKFTLAPEPFNSESSESETELTGEEAVEE